MTCASLPDPSRVLLVGNPNSGKTTLFNKLSGARAKVSNYPGVTVSKKSARLRVQETEVELVDLPGTYSLTSQSVEEDITAKQILQSATQLVSTSDAKHQNTLCVVVVSATALSRGLYLVLQVLETGLPTLVALNMMDEAKKQNLHIDTKKLSEELGVPVVPIVASKGHGLEELKSCISEVGEDKFEQGKLAQDKPTQPSHPLFTYDDHVESWIKEHTATGSLQRATSLLHALESQDDDLAESIIQQRYAIIDAWVKSSQVTQTRASSQNATQKMDSVLTHPILGLAIFLGVMLLLFQMLFTWTEPLVAVIEDGVLRLQELTSSFLPEGIFQELVQDGIIAGVGNILVFVPQIALLFFLIGILEDSGYLARVAFSIDRIMSKVGMHGKAFIPLLSGFGCAVPAVMATRTLDSKRDRLLTMMVLPLMSCSARLPVYVLITATVFGAQPALWGLFDVGAVVLFAMYALSVGATLGASAVLGRTVIKGTPSPFILELPPYRWPTPKSLVLSTWEKVRAFLVDAGTVILAITIVLWALLRFPQDDAIRVQYEQKRVEVMQTHAANTEVMQTKLTELQSKEAEAQLPHSFAGRIGKTLEPVFEPLGFDWRINVAVLSSFAAREVFVSSMGIVFGVGETDESSRPLRQALRKAKTPEGTRLLTPLSGISLMVFFVLACQCMSTLAVVKQESKSYRWPLFMFTYMSVFAYLAALIVYQVGSAMGWG